MSFFYTSFIKIKTAFSGKCSLSPVNPNGATEHCPNLTYFNDQSLWEVDYNNCVISIYENEIHTTCTGSPCHSVKNSCKHLKLLCKYFQVKLVSDLVYILKENGSLCSNDEIVPASNKDWINSECLICFDAFAENTRAVMCLRCKYAVHKVCWKRWTKTLPPLSTYKCIHCRNVLPISLKDNSGRTV